MSVQIDRAPVRFELDWSAVPFEERPALAARLEKHLSIQGLRLKYLCESLSCGEVIEEETDTKKPQDLVGSLVESTSFSPLRIQRLETLRQLDRNYREAGNGDWVAPRFWSQDWMGRHNWHAQGFRGEDVLVAIVDSGIDPRQSQISPALKTYRKLLAEGAELNLAFPKHKPIDRSGHGTALACQVAGIRHGMAPACQVLPIKAVFDNKSHACHLACGIRKALEYGAEVILTTITYPSGVSAVCQALEEADRQEAIVVCAAGNKGLLRSFWPGIHQSAICVGSIDARGNESSFNSSVNQIDLLAPGEDIETHKFERECPTRVSGTSFAAGIAAGTIALLCQRHKAATGKRLGRSGLHAILGSMPVSPCGRRILRF
ncbi:S8 family serine peptidase [bacterium]|nr:S8 family serine peptidase [bacterium]